MTEHAQSLGIDPNRIAVGGDSAGGNLAAVTALMARDRKAVQPMFQLLIYPVTDRRMATESSKAYRDAPVWNAALSEKMWAYYLPVLPAEHIEYASPMEAPDLTGLPDAYLEVAEFDSLRDEGLNYAAALEAAGVKVTRHETRGTPHGFEFVMSAPLTLRTVLHRAEILKAAFER
jgi:acetyl esterase/lipase